MPAGFLYVLINPAMPGLSKVGKTTRDPSNRVSELSSATGVPSPFILAFQQPVLECDSAESWVHAELERQGFRHAENREFFSAPLHEIIQIVIQGKNFAAKSDLDVVESDSNSEPDLGSRESLSQELYALAEQYSYGTNEVLQDKIKALEFYEQAAGMGHANACLCAAFLHESGSESGIRKNPQKALAQYQKSVRLGLWESEAYIAGIFIANGQEAAGKAHWIRFFERATTEFALATGKGREICAQTIGVHGSGYCEAVANGELIACVSESVIARHAGSLLAGIERRISMYEERFNGEFLDLTKARMKGAHDYVCGTIPKSGGSVGLNNFLKLHPNGSAK